GCKRPSRSPCSRRRSAMRHDRSLLRERHELCAVGGYDERGARELEALGLVELLERTYVQCLESRDSDYCDVVDRMCAGRALLPTVDFDDVLMCENCGRDIWPAGKRRHRTIQLRVRPGGVARFLVEQFAVAGLTASE